MKILSIYFLLLLSPICYSNELSELQESIDKLALLTNQYLDINRLIVEEIEKTGSLNKKTIKSVIFRLEKIKSCISNDKISTPFNKKKSCHSEKKSYTTDQSIINNKNSEKFSNDLMADTNNEALSRYLAIKEKKRIQKINDDQGQLARVKPQQPSRTLKVKVSTNQQRYKIGQRVVISVTPNQDAYITIIDHRTSGKIHTIFPNKFDTNRFVRANQTIRIPRPQDNYDYIASAPTGPEFIKVIASTNASRFIQDSSLSRGVVFNQVNRNAGALSRNLNIILNKKQHKNNSITYDHKIYIQR